MCTVSRPAEHSVAQHPEHQGVCVGVGCQGVGSAKSVRKDTRHHETHQAHETLRSVDIHRGSDVAGTSLTAFLTFDILCYPFFSSRFFSSIVVL